MVAKSRLGSLAALGLKGVATATIAPLDDGEIDHASADKHQQQHRDCGKHLGGREVQLRHRGSSKPGQNLMLLSP